MIKTRNNSIIIIILLIVISVTCLLREAYKKDNRIKQFQALTFNNGKCKYSIIVTNINRKYIHYTVVETKKVPTGTILNDKNWKPTDTVVDSLTFTE